MKIRKLQIVSDFETGHDEEYKQTWVYLAGIQVLGEDVKVFKNIDSWFKCVEDATFRYRCQADVWFHNIQFDGDFIINYLNSKQIKYETRQQQQLYSITIKVTRGSRSHTIEFRDTYALLHRSIDTIGKAIGLPKLSQAYKQYMPDCEDIPQVEIDYLKRDVEVLAYMVQKLVIYQVDAPTAAGFGLREIKRSMSRGEAADQYNKCNELADNIMSQIRSGNTEEQGPELVSQYIDLIRQSNTVALGRKAQYNWSDSDCGSAVFDELFPGLSLVEDEFIRKAYKGGFCKLNETYRGKDVTSPLQPVGPITRQYFKQLGFTDSEIDSASTVSLDVNQLYLRVLRDFNLPCGTPSFFSEDIPVSMRCGFVHIKWSGRMNWDFGPIGDDLPHSNILIGKNECDWIDLYLTYPEFYILVHRQFPELLPPFGLDWLEVFDGCYDTVGFQIIDGFMFDTCEGKFDRFVNKWYKIKHGDDAILKILAKSVLVNAVGCMGKKQNLVSKTPVVENGVVNYVPEHVQQLSKSYVAVPAYVNAIGRCLITLGVNMIGDQFIYSDTDQIKMVLGGEIPFFEEGLPIFMQQEELGGFKVERLCKAARFLKLKTYIEVEVDGHNKITAAGIPQADSKFSWNGSDGLPAFNIGAEYVQLVPRHVKGGLALIPTTRKIKFAESQIQDICNNGLDTI